MARINQKDYLNEGLHPIIDQGQPLVGGYSDGEEGLFTDVPAIVFGDHTRCVKYIEEPFFAGADGVKILKPALPGNDRYWYHALRNVRVENLGYSRHFKLLRKVSFPVHSASRQTEICTVLDKSLNLIECRKKTFSYLQSLVKSRFVEMFGDPKDSTRWKKAPLSTECKILTGNTPSRKCAENYGDLLEWVKTDNIRATGSIGPSSERLSTKGAEKARVVDKGAILMVCIAGSVKSIGRVGLTDRRLAFNQQINAIIPGPNYLPEYLLWAFKLSKDYLCCDINMQLKGILNKTTLSAKEYALPPLPLQREFAAFAGRAAKLEFVARQQIEKLQTLYDSLAQEYFG